VNHLNKPTLKLHLLILGCKPQHRHTEQHDVFFGIGNSLVDLLPQIQNFWPDAGKIHIDSWRAITVVDDYAINIVPKEEAKPSEHKLFFLNLGGYKPNDLEEYHYKLLVVAEDKGEAITKAKKTAFFLHNSSPHIDDKYGVDVDDIYEIEDILPSTLKEKYGTAITKTKGEVKEDEFNIGYLKLSSIK
jgi:Domain of Unknown Function (DUF1543)